MSTASLPPPASQSISSLIGRDPEMERLREALDSARRGTGTTFLVLGPGGMGKTRMLRWLEREATSTGFQVSWGNGLQESVTPFFLFEQLFRRRALRPSGGESTPASGAVELEEQAAYLLFEEDRPRRLRATLSSLKADARLLFVTRENPQTLKERGTVLPSGSTVLWVTRMEGEGRIAPGALDPLAERATQHLRAHPGGVIAIEGTEYLTSQNSFPAVLRLFQFLRDLVQEAGGHLLVAINPLAFDKREVSLLESDAEVVHPEGKPAASPSGASADGGAEGEPPAARLLRYLGALERSAREVPQVLIIDDLHWADPQSGTAFQFLARNLRDLPVLMVGGAREEEIPSKADEAGLSLVERLETLSREGLLDRLTLRGLTEPEARAFASQVLGAPLAPGEGKEELAQMVRRTDGNPYFLRELFLQLRQDGSLREGPAGLRFAHREVGSAALLSTVPDSLRRLVLQRIAHLTPAERALLDTASVAGSEFDLPPVAAVSGISVAEAKQRVQELVQQRRLLEPSLEFPGTHWSFSHPLVWEVTASEMPPDRHRKVSRDLLEWWEEHRADDVSTLARLGHGSGDLERGLPWVRRALERSIAALSPESGAVYLAWIRDLRRGSDRPQDLELLETELDFARRLTRAGGPRQAARFLKDLLLETLPDQVRWTAKAHLARATEPFDGADGRRLTEELRAQFEQSGSLVPNWLRAQIESFEGYLLVQDGRYEEALALFDRLLASPDLARDPESRALTLTFRTWILVALGRGGEAEKTFPQALEAAGDNDLLLAQVYNLQGVLAEARGDVDGMTEASQKAATFARRGGNLTMASIYEYNSAEGLIRLGRLEPAEVSARHLFDLGQKFDLPRIRCCGSFLLAKLEGIQKNWAAALLWGRRSLDDARLAQRKDDIWECIAALAEFKGESGDLEGAIEDLEGLETSGYFRSNAAVVKDLPILVRFLERSGEHRRTGEAARRVLQAARSLKNPSVAEAMVATLTRLGLDVPLDPSAP